VHQRVGDGTETLGWCASSAPSQVDSVAEFSAVVPLPQSTFVMSSAPSLFASLSFAIRTVPAHVFASLRPAVDVARRRQVHGRDVRVQLVHRERRVRS
jgi:hypothetical protein